jgi:hypothetical protein
MARAMDLSTLVSLEKDPGQGSRPEDSPVFHRIVTDESPSPSLQNIIHPTGFCETARDDGRINEVMETLIPSLHEIPEPQVLHTFKGKEVIKSAHPEASCSLPCTKTNHHTGGDKSFVWSKGLGCELSPIKNLKCSKTGRGMY